MLPMILLILKIVGVLLLALLGLIVLLLFITLLVPLRYRVSGSFLAVPRGKVKVTWLLHILSVTAEYEGDLSYDIRIFGLRLKKRAAEDLREAEDMMVHAAEIAEEETGLGEDKPFRYVRAGAEDPKDTEQTGQEKAIGDRKPEKFLSRKNRGIGLPGRWLAGFKKKAEQAKTVFRRFLSAFEKLKFIFRNFCGKLGRVKEKAAELRAWFQDEANQKTIRLLIRLFRKLIRHLIPGRGRVEVVYGFDDPYVTGQALTAFSFIYPFCHKRIGVTPMFDRRIFTAEGSLKGRIRLVTLFLIAGRALLDKNFRRLIKRWL